MSKNASTLEEFLTDLQAVISKHLGETAPVEAEEEKPAKGKGKKKSSKKADPEPVEDEADDDEDEEDNGDLSERIAELKKLRITALRKMAKALDFEEDEVAEAEKDELAQAIAEAEAEDAASGDDEDEDEEGESEEEADDDDADEDESDEDEDEEEGDEYTRKDYLAMSLPDLKGIAKEAGYKAADLKGLDKDGIADLLLDEEGDDDSEEEEDALTEEDLREMSLAELKALCKDYGIKPPKGAKQDDLVELLMEDDEDE